MTDEKPRTLADAIPDPEMLGKDKISLDDLKRHALELKATAVGAVQDTVEEQVNSRRTQYIALAVGVVVIGLGIAYFAGNMRGRSSVPPVRPWCPPGCSPDA
jgi:hypothetical protein